MCTHLSSSGEDLRLELETTIFDALKALNFIIIRVKENFVIFRVKNLLEIKRVMVKKYEVNQLTTISNEKWINYDKLLSCFHQ